MTQNVDVVIVGGGHNGLTAGSYLAKAGLSTLIVEASPATGGMTSTNPVLGGAPDHLINEGAMDASLIRTSSVRRDLELARFGLREVDTAEARAGRAVDVVGVAPAIARDPLPLVPAHRPRIRRRGACARARHGRSAW